MSDSTGYTHKISIDVIYGVEVESTASTKIFRKVSEAPGPQSPLENNVCRKDRCSVVHIPVQSE